MNKKLLKVKKFAKNQYKNSKNLSFVWKSHIIYVEKYVKRILKAQPQSNQEIVLLSVWLHDLGRLKKAKDHETWGANFAKKHLSKQSFSQEIINGVYQACLTHSAIKRQPKTLEAKILCTADGLSHFEDCFYLKYFHFWAQTGMDFSSLKQKLAKKVEHDFNQKIFFPEFKKQVKPKYLAWKKALTT